MFALYCANTALNEPPVSGLGDAEGIWNRPGQLLLSRYIQRDAAPPPKPRLPCVYLQGCVCGEEASLWCHYTQQMPYTWLKACHNIHHMHNTLWEPFAALHCCLPARLSLCCALATSVIEASQRVFHPKLCTVCSTPQ